MLAASLSSDDAIRGSRRRRVDGAVGLVLAGALLATGCLDQPADGSPTGGPAMASDSSRRRQRATWRRSVPRSPTAPMSTPAMPTGGRPCSATVAGRTAAVEALIDAEANVDLQDDRLDNPFLYAGAEGLLDILRLVNEAGADPALTNRFGGTALIPAASAATSRSSATC